MWITFQFFIWFTSVNDGPLSPANTSHSSDVRKCFWQAHFMLSNMAGCLSSGTSMSSPIQAYFLHLPSTEQDNRCTVKYSASADKVDDSFFLLLFFGNFLLIISPLSLVGHFLNQTHWTLPAVSENWDRDYYAWL
jgi:hypothetical protein